MARFTTLSEFIIERQKDFFYTTNELSRLLSELWSAAKVENREMIIAGLTEDILGVQQQRKRPLY